MDVLYWIRQVSRLFKPFVENRVGTVQGETTANQWRYVPTKQNPADLLSRGMTMTECYNSEMWWHGPEYLSKEESEWPITTLNNLEKTNEKRKIRTIISVTGTENETCYSTNCFEPRTFSSWERLVRVRSWVKRFVCNCQRKIEVQRKGELSVGELHMTECELIVQEQREQFSEEVACLKKKVKINGASRIIHLNPTLDDEGLMRSNSRIVNAEFLEENTRYPIILAAKSWITRLIIGFYHQKRNHYAGVNHLLSDISERYWIQRARQQIKSDGKHCVTCIKRRAKGMTQIMAPLPSFRFKEPLRAFGQTAVDYAGPFETIQGRGRVRTKRYVCLFTCLQTRAVHLEMSYGLDTDSFIKAFIRFIGRRGKPELVISDNGTNFVGASGEIAEIQVDNYRMKKFLSNEEIRWAFNPPLGSHFGGVFEALVKSVKKAMNAVMGNADISDEELLTILIRVEEMVNTRPLTIQSADEKEITPLTPNHFLLASWQGLNVEMSDLHATRKTSTLRRWRRVMELSQHVWRRWMQEVVPMWGGRQKWMTHEINLKIGDIVGVLNKRNEMGHWPLARVTELVHGQDQEVRVVKLRSDGKDIVRPIVKLFLIHEGCLVADDKVVDAVRL